MQSPDPLQLELYSVSRKSPQAEYALSAKSASLLNRIAMGQAEAGMVAEAAPFTCSDLVQAAKEALAIHASAKRCADRLKHIHERHPRAYALWSEEEDQKIIQLFRSGQTAKQIAQATERQPTAIASRLMRLGVLSV